MKDPYYLYKEGKIPIEVLKYDQYYCDPIIAEKLCQLIDLDKFNHIIEPTAGSGAFSRLIPECEAYDIDPQHKTVIQADFWNLWFNYDTTTTLIIGGPPYGYNQETAIKIFERCTLFADTIAFILPQKFRNPSNFKLKLEHNIPKMAFTAGGFPFAHPSSFQIYVR